MAGSVEEEAAMINPKGATDNFTHEQITEWYEAYRRVTTLPAHKLRQRDLTLAVIPKFELEKFYVGHALGKVDMALLDKFEFFLERKINFIEHNSNIALYSNWRGPMNWFDKISHPQDPHHAQYTEAFESLRRYWQELEAAESPHDRVIAFDNIVSWVHGSGSVARWFVEGGMTTLNGIFSEHDLAALDERNPRRNPPTAHLVTTEGLLGPGDREFLTDRLMPYFGITKLLVKFDDKSTKKWPDLWCEPGDPPSITVTREWARQNTDERRKRLTHECIHLGWGKDHNDAIGYNTVPAKDKYSMMVYRKIIARPHRRAHIFRER